jgi:phosphatidylglycerophosphatase A
MTNSRPPAAIWLATWGGCGYFPKGPGTAGSLGGALVAAALVFWIGWPSVALAALALVMFGPAVWASGEAARYWQQKDPQRVVVDEVLGQWLALAAAPDGRWSYGWPYWLAAFALFRLFDIWKPFPARSAERLPGGWGIVADDLVAGIYAAIVVMALRRLHF